MSPIGRIFVVLNLVLAAAFLGWASNNVANSKKFKTQWEEATASLEQLTQEKEAELSALRTEKQSSDSNAANMREARDREELRANSATQEIEDLQTQRATLQASVDKFSETIDNLRAMNERFVEEKDRANQAREEALNNARDARDAADEAEKAMRDAQEALANATRQVEKLEMTNTSLQKEYDSVFVAFNSLLDKTGISRDEVEGQPLVEGTVLRAMYDFEPGLVALNVGANQSVKRGMTFEIYRGSTYKGKVRVEQVHDTMSTALITNMVPGQTIQQGDGAATRL